MIILILFMNLDIYFVILFVFLSSQNSLQDREPNQTKINYKKINDINTTATKYRRINRKIISYHNNFNIYLIQFWFISIPSIHTISSFAYVSLMWVPPIYICLFLKVNFEKGLEHYSVGWKYLEFMFQKMVFSGWKAVLFTSIILLKTFKMRRSIIFICFFYCNRGTYNFFS